MTILSSFKIAFLFSHFDLKTSVFLFHFFLIWNVLLFLKCLFCDFIFVFLSSVFERIYVHFLTVIFEKLCSFRHANFKKSVLFLTVNFENLRSFEHRNFEILRSVLNGNFQKVWSFSECKNKKNLSRLGEKCLTFFLFCERHMRHEFLKFRSLLNALFYAFQDALSGTFCSLGRPY